MTRDEYVAAIKSAAISIIKADITKFVASALPIFKSKILGGVLGFFAGALAQFIIEEGETQAFFKFIDLRTSAQGREFEQVALKNKQVQETGTPDEKRQSEKALIDSFRAFVRIGN